ncbi:hypothetical protein IG193_08790 [Infirmifilum lucidum]|uniref:Uncharacterized protein n=1 Tax=Infirmifilum lucidum TaxID=2776706 RepID=A0A7L9FGJ2_9CREN|nr:hypothetical protein [Infirmifilum lucidum]QOJ78827.1 hypothetical protein IG193_08790 [Infirmifilum lucidum]
MKALVRVLLEQLKSPAILVPLVLLVLSAATGLADPKNDPFPTPNQG